MMNFMATYKNYIGLDPGTKTGLAVWDGNKFPILETVSFWKAYRFIKNNYNPSDTLVVIEKSKTKKVWQRKGKQGVAETTAFNVGMSFREAELLIEGLESLGFKVLIIHPQGKMDSEVFKRYTKYEGRTSEHARDAGMLVFKMG